MRFEGKRVLVTQSEEYMGPTIVELMKNEGADVIARPEIVPYEDDFEAWVSDLPEIDILIANLAHSPSNSPIEEISTDTWVAMYNTMVHPLMALVRYFAPKMAKRGGGKIVAVTSAAPLRGIPGSAAYCAARGAQNAFIRAAGLEFASRAVNINAVAQNYVSNPAYYPDDLVATERFQKHLERNVPIRRVARSEESAELALFLASDKSDFIVGQVIPFAGGWVTNT